LGGWKTNLLSTKKIVNEFFGLELVCFPNPLFRLSLTQKMLGELGEVCGGSFLQLENVLYLGMNIHFTAFL